MPCNYLVLIGTASVGNMPIDLSSLAKNSRSSASRCKASKGKWHIPTYKGLVLGKSTVSDVVRAFGKPIWSGSPIHDELEGEVRSELLYEYQNVGKCRITLKLLREQGADFDFVNYYETPLTALQLRGLITKLGISPRELLRKDEQVYRDLKLARREVSDD